MKTLSAAPLLAAGMALSLMASCITETEAARPVAQGMRTSGVIVNGELEPVWAHVQGVLQSMTNEPLESRGLEHTISTTVNGDPVMVLVERYSPTKTIIHVTSPNQRLADAIGVRVMR